MYSVLDVVWCQDSEQGNIINLVLFSDFFKCLVVCLDSLVGIIDCRIPLDGLCSFFIDVCQADDHELFGSLSCEFDEFLHVLRVRVWSW